MSHNLFTILFIIVATHRRIERGVARKDALPSRSAKKRKKLPPSAKRRRVTETRLPRQNAERMKKLLPGVQEVKRIARTARLKRDARNAAWKRCVL